MLYGLLYSGIMCYDIRTSMSLLFLWCSYKLIVLFAMRDELAKFGKQAF